MTRRHHHHHHSHAALRDAGNYLAFVGLASSNGPQSHAGGTVATGRASHAEQVKGAAPDEKEYPGPPGWGLGVRPTTSIRKKLRWENLKDASDMNDKHTEVQVLGL